jgi:hypothetical protein
VPLLEIKAGPNYRSNAQYCQNEIFHMAFLFASRRIFLAKLPFFRPSFTSAKF